MLIKYSLVLFCLRDTSLSVSRTLFNVMLQNIEVGGLEDLNKGFMNEIEGMNNYLCPRAQPENINNGHALNFIHEPRSYIINDIPSFIRHYFADSYLQSSKNTRKKHQFYCQFSRFLQHKSYRKIDDLIGCTIQNRGVRYACAYAWAHDKEILWCIWNFWRQNFLKHHFIFTIKYTELKMIHLERVMLLFIKTVLPISENVTKYRLSASPKRVFKPGC